MKWTKLSCRRFKDNAARLQLFALAYNLANFLRQLVLPQADPELDADDAAGEADQDRGQGGSRTPSTSLFQLAEVAVPAAAVRRDTEADRPAAAGVCLGLRLAAPTNGSASRRRASAVRRAGRRRREATCQGFLDQAKVKAEKATAYIEKASAFWQELKNTATVSDVPNNPRLEEGLIATGGLSGNIDLARQWLEEVRKSKPQYPHLEEAIKSLVD